MLIKIMDPILVNLSSFYIAFWWPKHPAKTTPLVLSTMSAIINLWYYLSDFAYYTFFQPSLISSYWTLVVHTFSCAHNLAIFSFLVWTNITGDMFLPLSLFIVSCFFASAFKSFKAMSQFIVESIDRKETLTITIGKTYHHLIYWLI